MPASLERERALSAFVDVVRDSLALQNSLNLIDNASGLKSFVDVVDASITGLALIPYDQATSCLLYTSPSPRDPH